MSDLEDQVDELLKKFDGLIASITDLTYRVSKEEEKPVHSGDYID